MDKQQIDDHAQNDFCVIIYRVDKQPAAQISYIIAKCSNIKDHTNNDDVMNYVKQLDSSSDTRSMTYINTVYCNSNDEAQLFIKEDIELRGKKDYKSWLQAAKNSTN